ncbi:MAG: S8 family serine peptidase, partial [Bacteroidota bacterium]
MLKRFPFLIFLVTCGVIFAQNSKPKIKDWHYLDYEKDGYRGISLAKAYDLLKNRKSETVIVAIIDSGIDTLQPDLKPVLWTNPAEIPNNNIDDDGNGLIDDYYGWNYLGAPNGENLSVSVSDIYRTYHRFKKQFEGKNKNEIPTEFQWQYREWKRAEAKIDTAYNKAREQIDLVRENWEVITKTNDLLKKVLNKNTFTNKDLTTFKTNKDNKELIDLWKRIFEGRDFTNDDFIKDYGNLKKDLEEDITNKTTPPVDFRGELLKDDSYDISKNKYGNNNLSQYSGYHGTSVSSVVGAVHNNQLGIDGIANNVKIMMIRGILGKDEFDKDVALSIRYAVDHGAKVINMSFGKSISPDKRWVDDAVKYALSKDVVLVHAAGNDGEDIDIDDNYPSFLTIENEYLPNLINVGASGDASLGNTIASFSNYGKKMVDV